MHRWRSRSPVTSQAAVEHGEGLVKTSFRRAARDGWGSDALRVGHPVGGWVIHSGTCAHQRCQRGVHAGSGAGYTATQGASTATHHGNDGKWRRGVAILVVER